MCFWCIGSMRLCWTFCWLMLVMLQVEANNKIRRAPGDVIAYLKNFRPAATEKTTQKSWRPYDAVDSEILRKARDFLEILMSPPSEDINLLTGTSASLYLPIRADQGLCRNHSQYALDSVLKSDLWALRMIDAASRIPPTGVLDGRIQDLGNYDQCVRVEEPGQQFRGQHCLVDAWGLLPDRLDSYFRNMATTTAYPAGFAMFSLCVPSTCDAQDIIIHLDRSFSATGLNISADKFEVFCSSAEPRQFRTKDWCTVGVCFIIFSLVVLSTWYESRTSGTKSELLSSFSLISNWRELKDTRVFPSDISCLNGLRVILAFFVMLTHRIIVYQFTPIFNFTSYLEVKNNPWMACLWSSTLATEIFFLISGVVRSYSFLRCRRDGKKANILKQFMQRYFRVTSSLAIVVLFNATINIHLSTGPLWLKCMDTSELLCNHLWWANLLHISNFLGSYYVCRSETWFLAADFQLFVLSPLLLLPLLYRPKLGLLLLAGVYVLSTVVKTYDGFFKPIHPEILLTEGPQGDRTTSSAHFNVIYRVATYVIGLALGYIILEVRSGRLKLALSRPLVWLGWCSTISLSAVTLWFSTLFISPSYQDSPWLAAVYLGLVESLWVAAAAWVVMACTFEYGGYLGKMLSWPGFLPLARISFGVYLTHMTLQQIHIFSKRQSCSMKAFDIVFECVADYAVSAFLATVLYLSVEAPCSRVTNYLLRPRAVATAEDAKFNGTAGGLQQKKKEK